MTTDSQTAIPVLLIDDDRFMRSVLSELLQQAGYLVTEATNGRDALELCRFNYYPIILTDWVMPEMDGLDFCRTFRTLAHDYYSYLILLTSQEGKDNLISGLEAGADEYLTKPVHQAELIMRLKTARRVLDLEHSLKQSMEEIRQLSIHDALTGAFNRGFLDQRLPTELRRSSRYLRDISVLMMDIDHFKKVNDTWGHQAGDTVLRNCAEIIIRSIRQEVDWLARYGGEEFVIVLPETDASGCMIVAERLRHLIENTPFHHAETEIRVTASFGATTFSPLNESIIPSGEHMLKIADRLLYEAKQAGRNRINTGMY